MALTDPLLTRVSSRSKRLFFLYAGLAFNLSFIATGATAQLLGDRLSQYLRSLPPAARVSLAVESLKTGDTSQFFSRADERVPAASIIKLSILVEAMEQTKARTFDPNGIHSLVDSEKTGGSGILSTYPSHSRIAYRDLLTLMITRSDNTATNILINALGMDAINQRMQALGLTQSRLNRVMMDTVAVQQGRENYVTAREMNELLKKMYHHELASPDLCDQMIAILVRNEDTLTIPRDLPPGTRIAHKTGMLAYVRGDAGIIYSTDNPASKPFVLSILVQGIQTDEAEKHIGSLARLCYDYFNP